MIAGETAPDFVLVDHTGRHRTLSEFLSRGPVVLFFYPLASSPICTAQACHFRDLSDEFGRLGAQRVGISTDTVDRQAHFARQRSFDYPLLSDADGVVSELFGVRRGRLARLRGSATPRATVWRGRHTRRRGLLGRFMPVRRATFVIGTDRTVLEVISSEVRASVHADRALRFLQSHDGLQQREVPPSSLTAGRDDAGVELPLEAFVEAADETEPPRWPRHDVRGQVLTCSAQSRSVAEIAAQLSLPLGATRFVVGELVTQGHLRVKATRGDSMTIAERRDLIERTLQGLKAL